MLLLLRMRSAVTKVLSSSTGYVIRLDPCGASGHSTIRKNRYLAFLPTVLEYHYLGLDKFICVPLRKLNRGESVVSFLSAKS